MYRFLILGGDARQFYLGTLFEKDGASVTLYYDKELPGFSLEQAFKNADVILCPVPFSKNNQTIYSEFLLTPPDFDRFLSCLLPGQILFGGNIPEKVTGFCKEHHISCHDYMKMESVALKNSIAAAEGAVAEAISLSPVNLHQSRSLICGFGRCGKTLASKLKGLDVYLTVADQNPNELALACACGYETVPLNELSGCIGTFHFIFNTIPSMILEQSLISDMNPLVTIIDLATKGGTDFHACRCAGISAKLCPGLPGIYSPLTSAGILYDAIRSILACK